MVCAPEDIFSVASLSPVGMVICCPESRSSRYGERSGSLGAGISQGGDVESVEGAETESTGGDSRDQGGCQGMRLCGISAIIENCS